MRRLLSATVLALAVGGIFPPAEAKTLEEILREKGVITEEDYKEATKGTDTSSYQLGKGITVTTRDGKTSAQVGGRLQARYTFDSPDEGSDTSEFSIRRMKLWLQGHVFSKDLFYKFQQNFGEGNSVTEDAYAGYKFAGPFALTLGQYKAPQSRQELTSSGAQLFVDRSLANDTFNLGRDIGLMAGGEFADHLVEYMVGGFNGNGPNRGNEETEHMLAARIDVNPLGQYKMDEAGWPSDKPLLNIGASFAMEKMIPEDIGNINTDNDLLDRALNIDSLANAAAFQTAFGDELDWWTATANAHFTWRGATLGAEYYFLNAEPDAGDDWDADGYHIQAGYQVIPRTLELAARYSAIDSDSSAPDFARFEQDDLQFGINYYFARHNAKLQADYTLHSDDLNGDRDADIFRLQAQVIF